MGVMWNTAVETEEEKVKRLRANLRSYANAGLFARLTYTFVSSLLSLGKAGGLDDGVGPELLPEKDTADKLAAKFDVAYDKAGLKGGRGRG